MISTELKMKTRKVFPRKSLPVLIKVSTVYPESYNNTVSLSTSLGQYLSQYCNQSTIHGLKYVGERGRYLIEKVIWLVLLLVVCAFCVGMICMTYYKWKNSPVILSFENGETQIFDIAFPAVTICPEAKFDPSKLNLTDMYIRKILNQSLNEREQFVYDLYSLVCTTTRIESLEVDMLSNTRFLHRNVIDDIFELFPKFILLNGSVKWMGTPIKQPFKRILTKDGVCYTFNMLSFEEIFTKTTCFKTPENDIKSHNFDLSNGYTSEAEFEAYPRRTFLAEEEGGLSLDTLITNASYLNVLCEVGVSGFKMVLHNVLELPNMNKHFRLPLDHAMNVAVKPNLITMSRQLSQYAPSKRNCYLVEERPLWIYKLYTQENCLNECLCNCTLLHCGCVPFYMPRPIGAEICGPGSTECLQESEVRYLDKRYCEKDCDCLPSCHSLSYEIELSQSEWSWQEAIKVLTQINPLRYGKIFTSGLHVSKVNVFFKDLQFLSAKRHELYGVADLFSKVGGLCGLCIGLSVVSIIEIIYFFTLRLVCNIKKYDKKIVLLN